MIGAPLARRPRSERGARGFPPRARQYGCVRAIPQSRFRPRETRGDVLRAVPIEGFQMQQEGSLGLSLVSGKSETSGEIGRGVEIARLHVRQNLETRAVRVIHQDQGDAIIGADIAQADVLPVAAKVGEAERLFVEDFEEAGRTAAMLHIRPARFRDARHIEAVASLDEGDFVFGESIGCPIAVEALATALGCRSPPGRRERSGSKLCREIRRSWRFTPISPGSVGDASGVDMPIIVRPRRAIIREVDKSLLLFQQ